MIKTSMLDFARTGRIGPIHCGLPREDLRKLLGDPPNWGLASSPAAQAQIWRYGNVEFHFNDLENVYLIFSDHDHLTDGGDTLCLDPWVIQKELPRAQFEAELVRVGIDFVVVRPAYDPNQRIIETVAKVNFVFMEEYESFGPPRGLVSWSIIEPPSIRRSNQAGRYVLS